MSACWLSLVPARLLQLPPGSWDRAALGRGRRLAAVVMIVDVSGFTALSETVARSGPDGTERLTRTINALFTPIVDLVHAHGGEVALYVGDAVVALLSDAASALACARAVHGAGELELSVGLAAGALTSTVVGDPAGRLEHVLIGSVLARAAAAQARAGPGGTVAGDLAMPVSATYPAAPHDAPVAAAPPAAPHDAQAAVAPFLHPRVAARLTAGRERALAEHRRVTSLFCRFEALREDDPGAPARVQTVVASALETLARFDGALLQVELVDKGSTLKATFGAPVAHDDDERRATACARALLARPEFAGAAVGLSTGTVFCGLIGSAARREYTVLGDAVNVAARLMLAARPGQILATEATRERAGDFGWDRVGPLALRGRAGAVSAFAPSRDAAPAAATRRRPVVGRERELETALGALGRAVAGEGGVLTITGEAGIGKSRLLDELAVRARGVTILRGAGAPFGRDLAYGAWRDPAAALVGDDPSPALAPLFGRPASGIDPERGAEFLRELVVARVRGFQAEQPLMLAFEDCQWLDDPSRELLERLARELATLRVLLVLTIRTGEARSVAALPRSTTIALGALDADAVARLVPGPPGVVEAIVARCGGNPLFAEELVNLWRRNTVTTLPLSLRAVVTARLDTLSEREHAVLRIASVIGPRFAPDWLSGSDPRLGGPLEVARTLGALTRLEIVRPDGDEHVFKHAVLRDVAYETLALAAREDLHEAVARHIERTHDLELSDTLEALVHHYSHTPDTAKQRVYLRRAGDVARAAFANAAAIRHFDALRAVVTGAEAFDTTLDLAAVLQLSGDWAQAEALYGEALAGADSAPNATRARAALGGLLAFTGGYPEAVARLEEARGSFAALGDHAQLAGVLERLAHTYFQQGDDEHAAVRAREHAALARELGDRAGESTAMNTLALVLWHRGELDAARAQLEAALALAEAAGHRVGVIHSLNDLAGLLVAQGQRKEAIERLGEAYVQAGETGYRRFQGLVVGNAAELFQAADDDDAALACAGRSLAIGASLGDVLQVIHNALVIAAVRARAPDPSGAAELLQDVIAAARATDNRRYLAAALVHQARFLRDREPAAEALAIARAMGQADIATEAEAILAGAPAPAFPADPGLDASRFLDGEPATPDGPRLVARAAAALAALNTSDDVVATGAR